MAEHRRSEDALEGRDVEVYLKTPLFRFKYVYNGQERELLENAVRISGIVLREKGSGILMRVHVISNMKKVEKELPFQEVFLPFSKIDFVVVS